MGWETAEQSEKGIVGAGWGKTAEKSGLKVQSPIGASGVVPGLQKKKTPYWKKMIYSKGSVTGDRVGAWIQEVFLFDMSVPISSF